MATSRAHVNTHGDKAWHYTLLSSALSAIAAGGHTCTQESTWVHVRMYFIIPEIETGVLQLGCSIRAVGGWVSLSC